MELSEKAKQAFLKKLGHRVERLIYDKFGNKNQFIEETGFYKQTLHDITTGSRDAHIWTLKKLAAALDVPLKAILDEE